MARAGYALDVGAGRPGRAGSRAHGGRPWWSPSARLAAARARRRRRDRRRWPWPDARRGRRRGEAVRPGDHVPRHARRRPRRTSWPTRPASAAGRSARCRRRSGWSATSPTSRRATRWYLTTWEWLAFRLTGVAAAPLVPGQTVARSGASSRVRPGCASSAACPDRRWAPSSATLTVDGRRALGLRPGIPVAGGHERRVRELPGRGADASPAMRTTRAARPAGSACTGTSRSRCPGRS